MNQYSKNYQTYSNGFYHNSNQNILSMTLCFNDIENLGFLPIEENGKKIDKSVKWISLSELGGFYIFPNEFKPENFNQGNTGLCFFFSSLASIAGVPGLIHQLFGNINNWNKTKQFIVYLFYKIKEKKLL